MIFSAIETFLSDVGGAAGLVLGMSLATILGTIDCLFAGLFFALKKYFRRRTKQLLKNVSTLSGIVNSLSFQVNGEREAPETKLPKGFGEYHRDSYDFALHWAPLENQHAIL